MVTATDGLVWLDTCGSTNDEAFARAADATVRAVAAAEQTAGRGRRGRTWLSPAGCGLYLTWLCRPGPLLGVLPLLAAVATAELCTALGVRPTLKWPNDLLVGGRKLAGILCEARSEGRHVRAAVGIGLNLRTPPGGYPADVPAVALDALVPAVPAAPEVARALLARLEDGLRGAEVARVVEAWQAFAPPIGTRMRQADVEGAYAGLTAEGALRLATAAGERIILFGEVELVQTEDP